ncbi:hypothetical protein HK102_008114 [Quaeritorhiza haematococci]|nr:hypothetical protein HK102_008114 [Quaeritorhiza haematococci]
MVDQVEVQGSVTTATDTKPTALATSNGQNHAKSISENIISPSPSAVSSSLPSNAPEPTTSQPHVTFEAPKPGPRVVQELGSSRSLPNLKRPDAKVEGEGGAGCGRMAFKPRTSSLAHSQVEPPTQANLGVGERSWAGLITSFVSRGKSPSRKPSTTEWDSDTEDFVTSAHQRNRRSVADMLKQMEQQETLLEALENTSAKMLLDRLERENYLLTLNPKTILTEAGNIRVTSSTYQDLMTSPNPDDEEFWRSIIQDPSSIHKIPTLLTTKIRAGIPPHLRSQIWRIMCGAQTDRLTILYPNLLAEDSPHDRIIKRDIPRTFPKLDLFKEEGGKGQTMLYNLLKAYSIYDSEVGYCQGLSFLVGPLIMQNMTEEEAFSVLVRLMEDNPSTKSGSGPLRRYAIRSLFTPQMPGLHLMLYQHTELVKTYMPALHQHFTKHGISATMYGSQWFLTNFTYAFPFPLVFRIFDIMFAEGAVETMLRFSLAILKRNEENLLGEEEMEGILMFLKGDLLYQIYENDPEKVVKDAMAWCDVVDQEALEALKTKHEETKAKGSSDVELQSMRVALKQLRAESNKMMSALQDLGMRNAELEKKHAELLDYKRFATALLEEQRLELERQTQAMQEIGMQVTNVSFDLSLCMNGFTIRY